MIRFSTKEGHDGQFYWHARSSNGKITADGAEGYSTKSNARRAVRRFVQSIGSLDYEIADDE